MIGEKVKIGIKLKKAPAPGLRKLHVPKIGSSCIQMFYILCLLKLQQGKLC